MSVVDLKIVRQTRFKIVGRIEIAALEKSPRQDAQPQLHLIQPGAMLGRKVQDMLMGRITQEGASLDPALQGLGSKGEITPRRDQATHVEAPVGIEVIDHPIVALHRGQLVDHVGQMGSPICTGARLAQIPDDLTRGDDERSEQGTRPMPDVLVLAFFRFPWGHGLGGIFALQNLHAGLFITANDHPVLLKAAQGVEIQSTQIVRFGLEVRVVAVEPIDTAVGFEVRLIQQTPDTRTTHRPGVPLRQGGDQVVETPARGGAMVADRFTGGHRHHVQTR